MSMTDIKSDSMPMQVSESLVPSDSPPQAIVFKKARLQTRFRAFLEKRLIYVFAAEAFIVSVAELSTGVTAVVIFVCVYGTSRYVVGKQPARIGSPVLLLEKSGDYASCLNALQQSAAECTNDLTRAMMAVNSGYFLRRSGQLEAARTQFLEVQKLGIKTQENVVASNLAFVNALLGDMEEAKEYMSRTPSLSGATHAFLWARTGNIDAVQQFVPPATKFGMKKFRTHEFHVVALMKAFTAPSEEICLRHVLGAQQSFAGEFDYLAENWPELATFLEKHKVELAPPPSSLPEARLLTKN